MRSPRDRFRGCGYKRPKRVKPHAFSGARGLYRKPLFVRSGAPAVGQTCAQGSYHALLLLNPSAGEPQQLIDALAAVTANLNALQALIGQVK